VTVAEAQRRKRARRAVRQHWALVYGNREIIPGPPNGPATRMWRKQQGRKERLDGGVF
jgi:hypothetical protein